MNNSSDQYTSYKKVDFWYDLPEERIANRPLEKRDTSKLLHYQSSNINHHTFSQLPELLPKGTLLVFNNTRVIQARLYFRRKTGALIEIFLLHPHQPRDVQQAMQQTQSCMWQCMIGNKKKWKDGEILEGFLEINGEQIHISAYLIDREKQYVKFIWGGDFTFADMLQRIGELPLPPYLNRKATLDDLVQYQTIYAKQEGAVAAPTAGLHFTDEVMKGLDDYGVNKTYVTLHVSAGTFQPVKEENISAHKMHSEQLIITRDNVQLFEQQAGKIVPVGTTSMRVLESMYWLGVKIMNTSVDEVLIDGFFHISQEYAYQFEASELPTKSEAMQAIGKFMDRKGLKQIIGETSIFIMPGYTFRLCDAIITNFHMPESTLIMLISAFIGDAWREVYKSALANDYRFLSYGDSSILWKTKETTIKLD